MPDELKNRTTANDRGMALAVLIGALFLNLPPAMPDSILGFLALAATTGWVSRKSPYGGTARTIGNCLGAAAGAVLISVCTKLSLAGYSNSADPQLAWIAQMSEPASATAIVSVLCGLDLINCAYMKTDRTARLGKWINNQLGGGGQ